MDENPKASSTPLIILVIGCVLFYIFWEFDHRYDREIDYCMKERLSDYNDYKSCNFIGGDTCKLYEYDKQECKRKAKYEADLKNQ
jgi:hypothetical protein